MKLSKTFSNTPTLVLKMTALSAICTYTHLAFANEQTPKDCFSPTYSFTCADSQKFLEDLNIDINENILLMHNLHQTDKTTWGCHKGSFHADQNGVEYFVKSTQMMNEFIGSRLLNIILDTKRTPIVKLVDGKENGIASLRLKNFVRQNNVDTKNKKILDEIPLAIALDFIGIMNRGGKNMGYIVLSEKNILAARVDVDKSFTFGKDRWKGKNLESDHRNLHLLQESIDKYPRDQVIDALKKVTEISDETIAMTILECWTTLNKVGYPIQLEIGVAFGQQLIERKQVFNDVLQTLTQSNKTKSSKNKEGKEKNRKGKNKIKKKQKAAKN